MSYGGQMIYTVTLNPSIDYVMVIKETKLGELNRSSRELHQYGGKGINISVVLKNLDTPSICLGVVAGYIGDEIEKGIRNYGCTTDFIHLKEGCTRINVKIKEAWGRETEMNGNGPNVDEDSLQKLIEKIECLETGDVLILSGSIPKSVSRNIYGVLAESLKSKDIRLIVDAEKDLLLPTLTFRPFLVKPNDVELSGILERKLETEEEILMGARKIRDMGARNVLVSRGKQGALFLGENGTEIFLEAPKGTVVNTVGSGDSMIAGFLSYYERYMSLTEAARYAVAAGSAGAFSEELPTKDEIDPLFENINVRKV